MKKLVLSWESYDWIYDCAGMIMGEPSNFDVIIVCADEDIPIADKPDLCEGAVYVQRTYDLSKIGKELGIKKLMSLRHHTGCINAEKLIMELQLHIVLSGIKEVYYQSVPLLNKIFEKMGNTLPLSLYSFGWASPCHKYKAFSLLPEIVSRKKGLRKLIVGSDKSPRRLEQLLSSRSNAEIFREVKFNGNSDQKT